MTDKNFDIKLNDHYKLYVRLEDKIKFESELEINKIKYYFDLNEQPMIGDGIRYFLLDSDAKKIDQIMIDNRIVANIESNIIMDSKESHRTLFLYLIIAGTVIGIIFLIDLIFY